MAQFIFEIPDAEAARIATAVCRADGFGPADMTAAIDHTREHVFKYLARITVDQEANAAAVAAGDAVRGNASDPLAAALFTPVLPDPEPGPVGPDPGPVAPTGATAFGIVRR